MKHLSERFFIQLMNTLSMENSEGKKSEKPETEERSLEDIQREVDFLSEFTEKLQKSFNIMEDTVKNLNKTMELLTQKVENNNNFMQKTLRELKSNLDENGLGSEELKEHLENGDMQMQPRMEINETNFLDALLTILQTLQKETPDKEYTKITETRQRFKEEYSISDEKFEELLLQSHWDGHIELRPGTGKFSIKDHYGNIYHNISFIIEEKTRALSDKD